MCVCPITLFNLSFPCVTLLQVPACGAVLYTRIFTSQLVYHSLSKDAEFAGVPPVAPQHNNVHAGIVALSPTLPTEETIIVSESRGFIPAFGHKRGMTSSPCGQRSMTAPKKFRAVVSAGLKLLDACIKGSGLPPPDIINAALSQITQKPRDLYSEWAPHSWPVELIAHTPTAFSSGHVDSHAPDRALTHCSAPTEYFQSSESEINSPWWSCSIESSRPLSAVSIRWSKMFAPTNFTISVLPPDSTKWIDV